MASASASAAAVEGVVKASALPSPGSVAFSSQSVAVTSHARRPSSDALPSSWPKNSSAEDDTTPPAEDKSNSSSRRSAAVAPTSPYSSSDASETSDEERNPRAKSSASAANESTSGGGEASALQQSLPAISGAALLQLRGSGSAQSLERMNSIQPTEKRGDEQYEGGTRGPGLAAAASAGSNNNAGRQFRRSRSRSRERPEPNPRATRWDNNHNNETGGGDGDKQDVVMTSRSEDRSSFSGSSDDRELRILFHGREIYADDLIGLRVAKTFVGHGRFLGQVVKFDEPTSLYTVVYADGDAEELNIDNTIQILIQDEIERADPSLPPVASAYAKEVYPSRPESPEITGAKGPSSTTSSSAPQQQQRSQVPPPSAPAGPVQIPVVPSAAGPAPTAGSRPRSSALQISEREAQFVVGLFENHALPVLLREGWKVQTSSSGSGQRFYAPQGNFSGAGRIFTSALAVVEFIASDPELLNACFPQNVHAAILSLFPESSRRESSSHCQSRKRVPAAAPVDAEPYDMKRQRPGGGRDEMMTSSDRPVTSHMRPVQSSHGPLPQSSASQRHMSDQRGYRHSEDIVMEREPYAADRVPPVSSERFSGQSSSRDAGRNSADLRPGSHPEAGEYRRASPGDTRGGAPPHRGPPHESSGPRWSGAGGGRSALSSNSDPTDYRRQYADSPEWRDREMRGGGGSSHFSSGPPPSSYHEGGGGPFQDHSRSEDPPYYADRSAGASRPGMRADVGGEGPPSGAYRYQEVPRSPVHRSPSADHFRRHGSGPPPAGSEGPAASSSTRRDSGPPEYRNPNTGERMGRGGPPPPGRGDPGNMGGPSGRGPSFSMMDVDRLSVPRAGVPSSAASLLEHSRAVSSESGHSSKWENRHSSSERGGYDQPNERSRSPHGNEPSSQSYGGSQHYQHHHHRHQQQQSSHHRHHHSQRMPSNGDNNSYTDLNGSGGRAPSADLVPEQQQQQQRNAASPGSSTGGGGSKQADGKRG